MKHNPLLPDLIAAFPPTAITKAAFANRGGLYSNRPEYLEVLEGKAWNELDATYLARCVDVLSFAKPAQQVALLPLYLHLLLVFSPQSPVPGSLLSLLTPPQLGDRTPPSIEFVQAKFDQLVHELTDVQKAVVAATLQEFIATHVNEGRPAQTALDRYWGAFANGRSNPLFEQLRAAFPPATLPTDDVFDTSRRFFAPPNPGCRDPYEVAREEDAEYLQGIEGKTWDQLDRPFLARFSLDLAYFSTPYFLAVLPAHLNLLVTVDPSLHDEHIIKAVTPPDPTSSRWRYDYELARFDRVPLLNDAQKAVVAATLRRFVELYPHQSDAARLALDRYWHAY